MAVLATFDYFFDLPGELREQILMLLLVKPNGIIIGSDPTVRSWNDRDSEDESDDDDDEDDDESNPDGSPAWPINYFLVNHIFKREATAVYFRENTFHIYATGRKYTPPHAPADDPLQALYATGQRLHRHGTLPPPAAPGGEALLNRPEWAPSRARLRSVVLHVQRPGRGALARDVFAPLLAMILGGGLRVLDVRLRWYPRSSAGSSSSSASGSSSSSRALASPPMRELYRVLSDPDLDAARLRVPARAHDACWCAFHGAAAACGGREGQRAPDRGDDEDDAWIDVDIGALIRAHGGFDEQQRIFKVGD